MKKTRVGHGAQLERMDLDHVAVAAQNNDDTILVIDEALEKLATQSPPRPEVVKFRCFTGMEQAEIAEALGVSEPTVRRPWD